MTDIYGSRWEVQRAKAGEIPAEYLTQDAGRGGIHLMKTIVYRKGGCPWAAAVIGFLNELNIPFEVRNMTVNENYAKEAQEKSGKFKSPTLDIDGTIIADASVEDVAHHLEKLGWKV
jgi:glutaredoxin